MLDTALKKAFPIVVGTLVLTASYFQARGLSAIAGSAVAPDEVLTAPGPERMRITRDAPPSAGVVLERNAFDSVTGPLTGEPLTGELPPVKNTEPTLCPQGWVSLITASDDPGFSFASVGEGRDEGELVRIGDEIAGGKISSILWNRVWVERAEGPCYLEIGARPKSEPKKKRRVKRPKRKKNKLQQEIAERIEKVGPNHFKVDRSAVDIMLRGKSSFMRTARLINTKKGPMLRLNGRVRRTALAELGFKAGDRIKTINGFDMGDPEKALTAYQRLSQVDNVVIDLVRKGKPVQLEFDVK